MAGLVPGPSPATGRRVGHRRLTLDPAPGGRWGDLEFNGIALGSFGAIIIYQVLRALGGVPGTGADLGEGAIASPAGGVAPAAPRGRVEGEPPVADPPGGGGRGAGDEPGDRPAREP